MKKIIPLAILFIVFAINVNAQKINASKVPAAVKASFAKLYPGVTAKWEKEKGKFEAGFKLNGKEASAVFDANGTMEETEIGMKSAELPAPVLAYVKEHYKGKTIKEAAKITKADGTVNYEAEVAGKDVMFDASGQFIKEVKLGKEDKD